jgi:hypothetical protein
MKPTAEQFLNQLHRLDEAECIAWVERMRDALGASSEPSVATRAAEFDDHVRILRYRVRAGRFSREVVSSLLADGYGTLYTQICPSPPSHAAIL